MGEVIFYGFPRAFGRFWHSKYFRVRLVFGIGKATLMVFFAGNEPGNSLLSSKYSSPCGVALRASMAGFISR